MKGKSIFKRDEVDTISTLIKQKLLSNTQDQKAIRNEIRKLGFYASDFGIGGGYTVEDFLSVIRFSGEEDLNQMNKGPMAKAQVNKPEETKNNDESYIIRLCDQVLGCQSLRQHKFDFLKGDSGHRLPVDAFYPTLSLVIEYREKQHTETVSFFDERITSKGITRGEQRKKYDELRKIKLPENKIRLVEFDYYDFDHDHRKRLSRNTERDMIVLKAKLK